MCVCVCVCVCLCIHPIGLSLWRIQINTLHFSLSSVLPQPPAPHAVPFARNSLSPILPGLSPAYHLGLLSSCYLLLEVFPDHSNKTPVPITPQTLILHQDTLFSYNHLVMSGMIFICVFVFGLPTPFLDVTFQEKQTSPPSSSFPFVPRKKPGSY